MTTKFKVGDTVRLIANTSGSRNNVGDIGKVQKIAQSGNFEVQVPYGPNSKIWSMPSDLELVEQEEIMTDRDWELLANFIDSQSKFAIDYYKNCMNGHANKLFGDDRIKDQFYDTVYAPWYGFKNPNGVEEWIKAVTKDVAVQFCREMAKNGQNTYEAWTTVGVIKTEKVKSNSTNELEVGSIFLVKKKFELNSVIFKKGLVCKIVDENSRGWKIVGDGRKFKNDRGKSLEQHGYPWHISKSVFPMDNIRVIKFPEFL